MQAHGVDSRAVKVFPDSGDLETLTLGAAEVVPALR